MAKRRIASGIAAVGLVAALTAAVAWSTMEPGDVEAVPVIESAPPVENREAPEPDLGNHRGEARVGLAPPAEAPEILAAGLPSLETSAAAPTSSQYTVEAVDLPTGALLSQPVAGRKTSRFGNRFHPILRVWKLHTGLDFAAACGTPVGAAAPGKVTKVGWAGGNGMQVRVDHGKIGEHHVVTTYNHLSAVGVRVGQEVAVHQGVGRVGNTGYSTGCHLHFEVIANGWYTNPEQWLSGEVGDVDTSQMTTRPVAPPSATRPPTPTTPPTTSPVATPTGSPTATPTGSPTSKPSHSATTSPTPSPTPTGTASPDPGCAPVPTADPSTDPTAAPTTDPTLPPCQPDPTPRCEATPDPGATPDPQDCTTPDPTADPSGTPSPDPTATVSVDPSETPSPDPSGDPSGSPSVDPTDEPSGSTPGPTGSTPGPSVSASGSTGGTATPSGTAGNSPSASVTGTQQATGSADTTPTVTSGSTATAD